MNRKEIQEKYDALMEVKNKSSLELHALEVYAELLKPKKVFETYEIGTKVKFENMFDAKVRTGIITHWSPKHPLLYEITCDMDHIWFVSIDMVRLDYE